MISDIASYLRFFDGVQRRTQRDVAALPAAAAAWRPPALGGESGWCIGEIVGHIGSARLYFASAYRGEGWVGPPPELDPQDQGTWVPWLRTSAARFAVLLNDTPAEWLTRRVETIDTPGSTLSGWRILMMMIEHEVHHRSQINAYAGLEGWPVPDIFNRSAETISALQPEQRAKHGRSGSVDVEYRRGPSSLADKRGLPETGGDLSAPSLDTVRAPSKGGSMPEEELSPSWSRRAFLALGAMASAMVSAGKPRPALAHNLPPGQFGSTAYDRALLADGGYRAVFQSPNIEAAVQPANTKRLDHLLTVQVKNWFNGFQFSYQARPEELHVVVATYASANLLTYGDTMWQKYRLGEKYKVTDPETGAPAVRNLFWRSRFGSSASTDPDDPGGIWQDVGIEALQRRGVLFLT